MTHKIYVQPAEEPVTLEEVRDFLGISDPTDQARDNIIESHIKAARIWAENYTALAFITQTWRYYAYCFEREIALRADLVSVTSIKYLDQDGVQQTVEPSIYVVDLFCSRVFLANGMQWPEPLLQLNSVIIEYVCGFGLAEAVPEDIKLAIKFLVGHWENHQNRIEGAVRVTTVPYAVEQLLNPYRDCRNAF